MQDLSGQPTRSAAVPFDERPGAVNFALAVWAGLAAVLVVAAGGFDAAEPTANGWVRLGTLAATTGLLAIAFNVRSDLVARRLQLGVAVSLIAHTLGAIGLANVALESQADPFAEPTSPPLADRTPAPEPKLVFAPRDDAPVRNEFDRPVATAAVEDSPEPILDRQVAKAFTPKLDTPTPPQPEAGAAIFDQGELQNAAEPTIAAATFERLSSPPDAASLVDDRVLQGSVEAAVEAASDATPAGPTPPRLRRDRKLTQPVTRSFAFSEPAPSDSIAEPLIPPAIDPSLEQYRPAIVATPIGRERARVAQAPLVDVAPLPFTAEAPSSQQVVEATSPRIDRRRAPVDVPPTRSISRALAPPVAPSSVLGQGPTTLPDPSSDRSTPPPGARPRIASTGRRDRQSAPRIATPSPPLLTAPAPITPAAAPATTESSIEITASSPRPLLRRDRRQASSVASRSVAIATLPDQQLTGVDLEAGPVAVAPPAIALAAPRVASTPRLARPSRLGRPKASALSVPRGPIALPSRPRQPKPAFAGRRDRQPAAAATPPSVDNLATAKSNADNPDATIANAAEQGGAPPRTEAAIELGLQFLAGSQRADGGWSFREVIEANGRAGTAKSDGAATGLALLAMLGAGCDHYDSRHGGVVQRGLDYLVERQRSDGLLFPELGARADGAPYGDEVWSVARFYSHGVATIALCEAFGMTGDAKLRAPAQQALDYIEQTQVARFGGWRYTPRVNADLSVTGWQLMALRSGELAGLNVRPETYEGVRRFVESCREQSGRRVRFCYNPNAAANDPRTNHGRRPGTVMTAVGLLSMLYLGDDPRASRMQLGANHLLENLPTADPSSEGARVARISTIGNPLRDTYYWYYATQVMYHMGGDYWRQWNGALHPLLVDSQVRDGELAGSWDPFRPLPDRWSHFGGRHYVTTMNLLSLEVYYRHLPLYSNVAEQP